MYAGVQERQISVCENHLPYMSVFFMCDEHRASSSERRKKNRHEENSDTKVMARSRSPRGKASSLPPSTNWEKTTKTTLQKYIADTAKEINLLTKNLNRAVEALKNKVEYEYCEVLPTSSSEVESDSDVEVEVGHLVEITNNHGGLKGELAYVNKVTKKMVWLELYESDKKIGEF